jgi:putative hydrolase of the HAD superfamily
MAGQATEGLYGTLFRMIRAVLFDLYDTLLYLNAPLVAETKRQLAVRAGVDPDAWAVLWRENVVDRMLGKLGSLEDEIRLMLRQLGADPSPELVAELAETETAGWTKAVTLYSETVPTLTALRERGLKLGLISNCSAQAGAVLERIGLAQRFDAVVLSCDVGLAKPELAIFEHACRALDVPLAESMFVADGAFMELDAAKAAGIVAVKIEQDHQSGDFGTSTSFDHRIERLTEVLRLL